MVKQKRKNARINWLIPCIFRVGKTAYSDPIEAWGTIRNISLTGAEVATRFNLEPQVDIFLTFDLGINYKFKNLPAQTIFIRKRGIYSFIGIKFSDKVDRANMSNAIGSLFLEQE